MNTKLVIDIDHTILTPNLEFADTERRYAQAKPIQEMIDKINELHDGGFEIILHTARRMKTHNGDIEKIIDDVGDITEKWLNDHGVRYDELLFGKPHALYYIDDRSMSIDQFLKHPVEEFQKESGMNTELPNEPTLLSEFFEHCRCSS